MKKLLTLLLLLSLFSTFTGLHYRSMRTADRELLRLGVEDAARTVRRLNFNLQSVNTVGGAAVLANARTMADLIRRDRSYLESQDRLDALRASQEYDYIAISDSNGVVVAASPLRYVGFDLHSTETGRSFLPAITNRDFALVQSPCDNAFGRRCQFVAVARRDVPGSVVIGYDGTIVGSFFGSSVESRVAEMRIGREGWIEAEPCEGLDAPMTAVTVVDRDGEDAYVLETDCEGYRIRAFLPVHGGLVADDGPFFLTLILDLLLILSLCMSFTPALRSALAENASALALLFGRRATHVRHPLRVALVALPILLAVLFAYGWFEYSGIEEETASLMEASVRDMFADIEGLPTAPLYLRAKAICLRYGSPDAITPTNVQAIADEYGLDELNVVDSRRHIVASTMKSAAGKTFDMDSRRETKVFNTVLLDRGEDMYVAAFRRSVSEAQHERKYLGVAFERSRGGYVQVGYDRSRMRHELADHLAAIACEWRLGRAGFFVVTDAATGEIVSTGCDLYPEGGRLVGTPDGLLVREGTEGGLRVLAATPVSALREELFENMVINASLLIGLCILMVVLLGRIFGLVSDLRQFISADADRRRRDLALARRIQLSSLPVSLEDNDRYKLFATTTPAREVGGDFYDSYALADGREVVTVADVSGKGIPAALFMMRAKTALKSALVEADGDLAVAIPAANRHLCANNEGEMFVTAWIGVYDPATGEMKYVSAGHNPPLVRRADGSVEWVKPRPSLVLAAMDIAKYRVETLTFRAGDSLFVYTDGVTEAQDATGELFGEDRLEAALRASGPLFVSEIGKAVGAFVAGAEPSDDITMFALDVKRIGGRA